MFKNIENLKLINAHLAERTGKLIVHNRKTHLFVIRISGNGTFDFGDKQIYSPKGTLLFIPKASSYEFIPDGHNCISATISFNADIKNAKPKIYDISAFPDYERLSKSFYKMWIRKMPSDEHRCLSVFHSLIAYLIDSESIEYSDKVKIRLIEPALEYIETHLADTNLQPCILPYLCNISPAYFRRIFALNLGMTPQKYIEEKRLEKAFVILEENSSLSISEIARNSGYKDPLYFGKVFKKKYGISPSFYRHKN